MSLDGFCFAGGDPTEKHNNFYKQDSQRQTNPIVGFTICRSSLYIDSTHHNDGSSDPDV